MPTTLDLNLNLWQWLVIAIGLITTAFFSGLGSSIGSQIGLKLFARWEKEKENARKNKKGKKSELLLGYARGKNIGQMYEQN